MTIRAGLARNFTALPALTALLGLVPGTFATANEQQVLRVAVAIPRTQELAIDVKKYNEKLSALTDNAVQVRVYWGGAAGDDLDVLRKMKTGQMDAAPLLLELVSSFVRQALVLNSPGLFTNYKQVDAVREELTPAMDTEAYENGFKIMAWGDVGRLRLLSKEPVETLTNFKSARPWLYPQSQVLKEFYRLIGATGVPLSVLEVYGALQTNMIDVAWTSAVIGAALQWHTGTRYISEQSLGFISGAFVIRRGAWDALPESARTSMLQLANEQSRRNQLEVRKADDTAYAKLIARGTKGVKIKDLGEWQKVGLSLRERMVGRIYTKELVAKAEQIAKQYTD